MDTSHHLVIPDPFPAIPDPRRNSIWAFFAVDWNNIIEYLFFIVPYNLSDNTLSFWPEVSDTASPMFKPGRFYFLK